jgi:lysophospholipase L1-like esterase
MGPDGMGPIDAGYLGPDMTHPSQRGMELIADALFEAGYAPLGEVLAGMGAMLK